MSTRIFYANYKRTEFQKYDPRPSGIAYTCYRITEFIKQLIQRVFKERL